MRTTLVPILLLFAFPMFAAEVKLVAGGGTGKDGRTATEVQLREPFGVAWDKDGRMLVVEMKGNCLRRVEKGIVSTVGGDGTKGGTGDDGPAIKARFDGPHAVACLPNGNILLSDTWNNRVRLIDAEGVITTLAGTGEKGFSGDGGPATKAKFGGIYCSAVSRDGKRIYVADLDNRRIRRIDRVTGLVTTVAGDGSKGVPKDGSEATKSPLVDPRAVAVDADENVWILERGGHALRVVDKSGKIRTVAGTGKPGFGGDGGPAIAATLNGPKYLCVSPDGSILIADTENHAIRRFSPKDGKIATLAGTGKKGTAGIGGPPDELQLNRPHGVEVHADGDIYISDSDNHRVLRIVK